MDRTPPERLAESPGSVIRRARALALGLPLETSWDDIAEYQFAVLRVSAALARGLPRTATWEDIFAYDDGMYHGRHGGEVFRRNAAKGRGLPTCATWSDIREYDLQMLEVVTATKPARTLLINFAHTVSFGPT